MKSIVILISGRGSNMMSIVDAKLPVEIRAVISNRPNAKGLEFAQAKGISTAVVDHTKYSNRDDFDVALAATIDEHAPDFVILAGFMRVLTSGFVQRYRNRLINIHPSLLPAFTGLHTHERALQAGVRVHGCTVHFVTAELDHGPIIVQAVVPVLAGDTPDTLASRVLAQEHVVYPMTVRWLAEDRITLNQDGSVSINSMGISNEALIWPRD